MRSKIKYHVNKFTEERADFCNVDTATTEEDPTEGKLVDMNKGCSCDERMKRK